MKRCRSRPSTIRRLARRWSLGVALAGPSVARQAARRRREGDAAGARSSAGCRATTSIGRIYAGAVEKIAKALVDRCGFETSNVWVRFGVEPKEGDGPALKGSRGLSNRENLAADAEAIRKVSTPDDARLGDRPGPRPLRRPTLPSQHPGPRPLRPGVRPALRRDQGEGAGLLHHDLGQRLLPQAAGDSPGRIAISATEADQEVNETLFPLALADVLAAPPPEADRDKDGTLSVFELYLAVVADVTRRYIEDELIPTEHAQLDDNGDGRGSEVQMTFLPPESGGEADAEKAPEKGKAKAKEKVEPKLGPKDDGYPGLESPGRPAHRRTAMNRRRSGDPSASASPPASARHPPTSRPTTRPGPPHSWNWRRPRRWPTPSRTPRAPG